MIPLNEHVIAKRQENATKTKGGVYLPDSEKKKVSVRAKIVKVAENCDPLLKVGQTVIFGRYAGTDFENDDETLTTIKHTEILAIVEE